MAFRAEFTELAVTDLQEISEFVAQDDSKAARRVCQGLYDLALPLGNNPFSGRMTPEYKDPAIRDIVRGKYHVAYVVSAAGQTIHIIRFWHGARGSLPRRFH